MNRYRNLLSPLKVGQVIFKNRIFSAPMIPFALQNGNPHPTDAFMEHFVCKARGGAACISISGFSFFPGGPVFDLYRFENTRSLAALVDKIHAYGAKVAAEDIPGVIANPKYPYTVSGEAIPGLGYDPESMAVHSKGEMPESIMEQIADDYSEAAVRLRDIGFDLLLAHFLDDTIGQFLSPAVNKRTDKYGGSLENRLRFPMMILDRIRSKIGNDLLIWLRMAGEEKTANGMNIQDTIHAVRILQEKIDIVEVVGLGPRQTTAWELVELTAMPSDFMTPMHNVHLSKALKGSGAINIPVMTTGGLQDPDEMEGILKRGEADIIGMARGLIADPDLPNKLYAGQGQEIVPCVKCYKCVDTPLRFGCTVNPMQGWQHYKKITPASIRKRVAVVGGGPAGMEAAIVASGRGHSVTLFERGGDLGGQLFFADKLRFKRGMLKFKNYLIDHLRESNVEIKLNTTVTRDLFDKEKYDHVVIAIGAKPKSLEVPGAEKAIFPRDLLEKNKKIEGDVVVIGGGTTGCEMALYAAELGHKTTILEYSDKFCTGAHVEYARALLVPVMQETRITMLSSVRVTRIDETGVTYTAGGKDRHVNASTVVLAVGMEGLTAEALALWQTGVPTSMIGDCQRATDVYQAMHSAFDIAISI